MLVFSSPALLTSILMRVCSVIQTNLSNLKPTKSLEPRAVCMSGTRARTLDTILRWIVNCVPQTLWLRGVVGTGKSTLMGSLYSLADGMGSQSRLGAYIRFDREKNNDPSEVVTTLAYQLGQFDDRIGSEISAVVKLNPRLAKHPELSYLYRKLVIEPLRAVVGLANEGPIIVLIDGLDECLMNEKRAALLEVLSGGFGEDFPFVRLIIASRPDRDIVDAFTDAPLIKPEYLDRQSDEANHDIRCLFEAKFLKIRGQEFHDLCRDRRAVAELSARASGLFVWASTMHDFIVPFPVKRLLEALATEVPSDALVALDTLYTTALQSITGGTNDIRDSICLFLSSILIPPSWNRLYPAVIQGMTPAAIDAVVFDEPNAYANDLLKMLGSLCTIDINNHVRLIHKSFGDFLLDDKRCTPAWHIGSRRERRLGRLLITRIAQNLSTFMEHFERDLTAEDSARPIQAQIKQSGTFAHTPTHIHGVDEGEHGLPNEVEDTFSRAEQNGVSRHVPYRSFFW